MINYIQFRITSIHLIQVPLLILMADFITGLFHWLEDNYGNEKIPIIGKNVTGPNLLHHRKPRKFLDNSWLHSADVSIAITFSVLTTLWYFDALSWQIIFIFFILLNANEVHKWAHQNRKENGWFINFLHKFKLIQTPKQHSRHHGGTMNTNYCIITNFLNPILEKINLWRSLEKIINKAFNTKNRNWVELKKAWKYEDSIKNLN